MQLQMVNHRKTKMKTNCSEDAPKFDANTVKINFTLGVEEVDMILAGLICLPKERAEGLFNFMKDATMTEISEAYKQFHKELENGNP